MDDEIDALPALGRASETRGMFERGNVKGAEHAPKGQWLQDEGLPQTGSAAASRAAFQEAASKQVWPAFTFMASNSHLSQISYVETSFATVFAWVTHNSPLQKPRTIPEGNALTSVLSNLSLTVFRTLLFLHSICDFFPSNKLRN